MAGSLFELMSPLHPKLIFVELSEFLCVMPPSSLGVYELSLGTGPKLADKFMPRCSIW